ncbi:MAG: hypothetical protein JSS81_29510 [Acidobacteria bacterium]|nr:hypothetical protein [Acidobacteriota bacterium]
MKLSCLILTFLLTANLFAQTSPLRARQVFEAAKKVDEATRNRVWNEFEPFRYTTFSAQADGDYILFNAARKESAVPFSWSLADAYFSNVSLEDALVITFHEAFHAFEADAARTGPKWNAENSMLVFEYQETSARNNALFAIEARLLRAAFATRGDRPLREKVRQFLAVRALRQSALDPRFVEFEKGAEANEGMAEYAGAKTVYEALRRPEKSLDFLRGDADAFLSEKFRPLEEIGKVGKNVRRKFYLTGSAEGFLLDRLLPDWKKRVQTEGRFAQDLLAESVRFKTPENAETERLVAAFDYEKTLAAEEQSVAERTAANRVLLEKSLAQAGRRFVVDFGRLKTPPGVRSFDPMNVTLVGPAIRVHTRAVTFGGDHGFTASYAQTVVEDLAQKSYTTIVAENAEQTVTADGAVLDLNRDGDYQFAQSLTIETENFQLTARAGVVRVANGTVTITLID